MGTLEGGTASSIGKRMNFVLAGRGENVTSGTDEARNLEEMRAFNSSTLSIFFYGYINNGMHGKRR